MKEEVCKKCGSTNTARQYTKIGHFVDYYTLVCNSCLHREDKRT